MPTQPQYSKAIWYSVLRLVFTVFITFFPLLITAFMAPSLSGESSSITISQWLTNLYNQGTFLFLAFSIGGSAFVSFVYRRKDVKIEHYVAPFAWGGIIFVAAALLLGWSLFVTLERHSEDMASIRIFNLGMLFVIALYALAVYFNLRLYTHPTLALKKSNVGKRNRGARSRP